MSKGKTGLIVLTVLAAMFFLFIAVLFGSSAKRQGVIEKKTGIDDSFDTIAANDLTIYWIGEVPAELEHLSPVINVIPAETASKDNLPVKGPSFHTSEYNEFGQLINEEVPAEYPRYMMIIITGTPNLPEEGKEALLDAIARNGVPVLAIGDEASQFVCDLLSYRRIQKGPNSSLYYCLGAGYKENPIPEDKVASGGMDLAEAMPDLISLAMTDYAPQI